MRKILSIVLVIGFYLHPLAKATHQEIIEETKIVKNSRNWGQETKRLGYGLVSLGASYLAASVKAYEDIPDALNVVSAYYITTSLMTLGRYCLEWYGESVAKAQHTPAKRKNNFKTSEKLDQTMQENTETPKNSPLITKTTIIDFSTPQPIIPATYFIEKCKDDLQTIIKEEKAGNPTSQFGWKEILDLSKEEAKLYLTEAVSELLKEDDLKNEEKEHLFHNIFSERHFPSLVPRPNDIDTSALDEKSLFDFLSRLPYLDDAIFSSRDGHDHMQQEQDRIDPRVFLLKPDVVRKWYYTYKCIADRMSAEEYEKADHSQLKPELFSQYFTFPDTSEERSAYYRTHKISFLSQELIQNIYLTAQRILKQTTFKDRIVIFGNTPYFVGRALERIMSQYPEQANTYPKVIYLPFSGAPNIKSARNPFGFFYDPVTPHRFAHFKNRLRSLGLLSDNTSLLEGITYIVDVILLQGLVLLIP